MSVATEVHNYFINVITIYNTKKLGITETIS